MRIHIMAVIMAVAIVCVPATGTVRAEECVCRIEGASINVSNFPPLQKVEIEKAASPLEVRETDISKTYTMNLDLVSGEKRPFGPFPLAARHRAMLQITQLSPKTGIPAAVTAHWYVRFDPEDAFFSPCPRATGAPSCTTGLPVEGAKLRPLLPVSTADLLEGVPISSAPASIATFELVGTEGLLVIENASAGSRTIRIQFVLDR